MSESAIATPSRVPILSQCEIIDSDPEVSLEDEGFVVSTYP